jgi:hypothetical protein
MSPVLSSIESQWITNSFCLLPFLFFKLSDMSGNTVSACFVWPCRPGCGLSRHCARLHLLSVLGPVLAPEPACWITGLATCLTGPFYKNGSWTARPGYGRGLNRTRGNDFASPVFLTLQTCVCPSPPVPNDSAPQASATFGRAPCGTTPCAV